ncbi:hypothetical protein [Nostoc sp. CALU 1950]|uniref:hypothetical protein n=1 Tax=Nostoc sp. CALU 1950 TaxID=3104321 RepID=UPI003EBC636B
MKIAGAEWAFLAFQLLLTEMNGTKKSSNPGVASFPVSDWECILRGSASRQAIGGGASHDGFLAWRLGTSQGKGCILT